MFLIQLVAYILILVFIGMATCALIGGIWLSFKLVPIAMMAIGGATLIWVVVYAFDKLVKSIKEAFDNVL